MPAEPELREVDAVGNGLHELRRRGRTPSSCAGTSCSARTRGRCRSRSPTSARSWPVIVATCGEREVRGGIVRDGRRRGRRRLGSSWSRCVGSPAAGVDFAVHAVTGDGRRVVRRRRLTTATTPATTIATASATAAKEASCGASADEFLQPMIRQVDGVAAPARPANFAHGRAVDHRSRTRGRAQRHGAGLVPRAPARDEAAHRRRVPRARQRVRGRGGRLRVPALAPDARVLFRDVGPRRHDDRRRGPRRRRPATSSTSRPTWCTACARPAAARSTASASRSR